MTGLRKPGETGAGPLIWGTPRISAASTPQSTGFTHPVCGTEPPSETLPPALVALERARLAQEQHDRRIDVQLSLPSVRAFA